MRTDPRKACANEREAWFWAAVHDLLAHPLMVLTWYSRPALWLHDWTSRRAWPRPAPPELARPAQFVSRFGLLLVEHQGDTFYRVHHGHVDHAVTVQAEGPASAAVKAVGWFDTLAEQLGGQFDPHYL